MAGRNNMAIRNEVEQLIEKQRKINDAIDKQIQVLNTKDLNDTK